MRDVIQRLALANRHPGHRRIMREDNLLCLKPLFRPPMTNARHGWRGWPNLARRLMPMATNQLWVADLTYVRLAEAFIYLAVVLDAFSRKPDAERQSEVVGWVMAEGSTRLLPTCRVPSRGWWK